MADVAVRRVRSDRETTTTAILDATEQVMVEEGYAAVTTRRVAGKAGLKPPLVHYYYPTTDDLLVAAYRRAAEASLARHAAAAGSNRPLHAIWEMSADSVRTTLGVEFMALANHRKVIRHEIAIYAERIRELQAGAVAKILQKSGLDPHLSHAAGLTVLVAGVARALVMEEGVGISGGHEEARKIVEWCLAQVESDSGAN